MRSATPALDMSDAQREMLEVLSRSQTAPHREVQRARALLLAAEGMANTRIADQVGVSPATVSAWRARFTEQGMSELGQVRKGRGRKPSIPQDKIDEIVELTKNSKPDGGTHWSSRSMAAKVGVSPATVQRVWSGRSLKPHLAKTTRGLRKKLVDVVGLYLDPPDRPVTLCMYENSSVQALDRTQRSLPMVKRRAGTMTSDYKRHGTTTLFAAFELC